MKKILLIGAALLITAPVAASAQAFGSSPVVSSFEGTNAAEARAPGTMEEIRMRMLSRIFGRQLPLVRR